MQAVLAGASVALGVPATVSAIHELDLHSDIESLGIFEAQGKSFVETVTRLGENVPQTAAEQLDLAFALLAQGDDRTLTQEMRALVVDKAAQGFRAYLSIVPGDGRAWAGLASAEIARGGSRRGAEALKMSILTAPWSGSLVQWRCGLGIDLFRVLNAEERELMKGQFRVAAQRSPAALVQTVIRRGGARIARTFLASSPDELVKFEIELASRH